MARPRARAVSLSAARRVLIFRLGSLGDSVVALPALHLVRRAFATAERRLLTNMPVSTKAPAALAVLGGSGLVEGAFSYPVGVRDPAALFTLARQIRAWAPDVLVYLTEARGRLSTWRDLLFFRACGIARIVGAPTTADLRHHRIDRESGLAEPEAARLARCLHELGEARLDDPASWDLGYGQAERAGAAAALAGWPGAERFIAVAIASKADVKDWPEASWRELLPRLAADHPGHGLALIGAAEDSSRARRLVDAWPGPSLDLCGRLSPRESGVVLGQARLFVGVDSGPMHLAAAAGTPVVALFSGRARPGIWFPVGPRARALHKRVPCAGCGRDVCHDLDKMCIRAITPDDVLDTARTLLPCPA
jgi:ADP-heptose:LPS heptosyltransferase